MAGTILSLDQGTTSSRALVFDGDLKVLASAQRELRQIYPASGLVEHDPIELFEDCLTVASAAVLRAGLAMEDITAIGITNQRETTVVWERATGKPIANAIVWQDRRTSDYCRQLKMDGHEDMVRSKTGLLLDPYFSASKLKWILDEVPGARSAAEVGDLCFGTIDSWLIWKLTEGATSGTSHVIDATNASRTMLYNINDGCWDEDLLALFDIPKLLLPEVKDCMADFGETSFDVLGAVIPILGVAGDQHAALIGQACFEPGMMKSTYGTGCFALMNIGSEPVRSNSGLLTTLAYKIDGKSTYALEGSIFIAGAGVQWLRDGLGIINEASECDDLAAASNVDDPVCMVPAFAGLGAPYWEADVRGALMNLSRGTGREEIVRAVLESVGLQTRDLMGAMATDWPSMSIEAQVLRVDGGMARSDWTMQFLSDVLQCVVERPESTETTALGAAFLAGLKAGIYPSFGEFASKWQGEARFNPKNDAEFADTKYLAWQRAVGCLV